MLQDDTIVDYEYLNQPIYSGARVSVLGAYCCIMQYALASKLNYASIGHFLKLLQTSSSLCPEVNLLPKTFYKVKKIFKQLIQKHKYKRSAVCAHAPLMMD